MSSYDRIVDLVKLYFAQDQTLAKYVKSNFKPCSTDGCLEREMHCISLRHFDPTSPIQSSTHVNADKLILHGAYWLDNFSQVPPKFEIRTKGASAECVITSDEDVMQFLSSNFLILQNKTSGRDLLDEMRVLVRRVDTLFEKVVEHRHVLCL